MPMNDKAAGQIPSIADILAAKRRISGQIRTTPVLSDPQFNTRPGGNVDLDAFPFKQ
jgi:threonine dehydratase